MNKKVKHRIMFKNKNHSSNNLCGSKVKEIRKARLPKMSQRELADQLQLQGIDLDKNAVQRIESGQRFVTDIELLALSKVLRVSLQELLGEASPGSSPDLF